MKTFNSAEAGKVTDLSKQKIQRFVVDELLVPYKDSSGPGTYRQYSSYNLAELMIIKTFFDQRITTATIKEGMDYLRNFEEQIGMQGGKPILDPEAPLDHLVESYLCLEDGNEWSIPFRKAGIEDLRVSPASSTVFLVNLKLISVKIFHKVKAHRQE